MALDQAIGGLDLEELGGGSFALVVRGGSDKTQGQQLCHGSEHDLRIHAGREFP